MCFSDFTVSLPPLRLPPLCLGHTRPRRTAVGRFHYRAASLRHTSAAAASHAASGLARAGEIGYVERRRRRRATKECKEWGARRVRAQDAKGDLAEDV